MLNVYVAPGDVFDEVRSAARDNGNWIVPLILSCIVSVVFSFVVFSQEHVLRNMHDAQEKEIRKMVDAGKIPAAKADEIVEMSKKWMNPAIMTAFGSIGALVVCTAMLFIVALVLMLLGRYAFGAVVEFMKMVEVSGLASVIMIVSSVAKMFVVVATGRMELGLTPALFVSEFDPKNHTHVLLNLPDVTMLWYVGVVALGLARVSGVSWLRAALWLYPIWLVLVGSAAALQMLR